MTEQLNWDIGFIESHYQARLPSRPGEWIPQCKAGECRATRLLKFAGFESLVIEKIDVQLCCHSTFLPRPLVWMPLQ